MYGFKILFFSGTKPSKLEEITVFSTAFNPGEIQVFIIFHCFHIISIDIMYADFNGTFTIMLLFRPLTWK